MMEMGKWTAANNRKPPHEQDPPEDNPCDRQNYYSPKDFRRVAKFRAFRKANRHIDDAENPFRHPLAQRKWNFVGRHKAKVGAIVAAKAEALALARVKTKAVGKPEWMAEVRQLLDVAIAEFMERQAPACSLPALLERMAMMAEASP